MKNNREILFRVVGLRKSFSKPAVSAFKIKPSLSLVVDDASFDIFRGECLALIGESGSGKTTLGRCMLRLIPPDSGRLICKDSDLFKLSEKAFKPWRSRFQMVFQNPDQSLNPLQTVADAVSEPIRVILKQSNFTARRQARELLEMTGLAKMHLPRFPHELSGGEKQRVAIARALALNPEFIIADEPTSRLDAMFKRQIIDLFLLLKKQLNLTLMIISHDLSVMAYAADRIGVMFNGALLEIASGVEFFRRPVHPYSQELITSLSLSKEMLLKGETLRISENFDTGPGCLYSSRCPIAESICRQQKPALKKLSETHWASCHMAG